jgi:hypothetical protein
MDDRHQLLRAVLDAEVDFADRLLDEVDRIFPVAALVGDGDLQLV